MDERFDTVRQWLAAVLPEPGLQLEPASADASFRRYFRARWDGGSAIVMDAPPAHEDCRPFVKVAGLLHAAGVHAPEVLAQDLERGLLLLSDLGTQTYLDVLDADNADTLFADALAALIRWQRASRPGVLPPYDRALLARELALFPDWYLGRHRGLALAPAERGVLDTAFRRLEDAALAQPQGFVHRDYMPRNLMPSTPNPGVIDFQDAVHGPLAYDVISLFKDAFLSWPEARVEGWLAHYHDAARRAGLPLPADFAAFRRDCDWIGLQRHLKVIGIFARICHRDGKPHYLADVPRFFAYVRDVAARYAEFDPLLDLLDALEARTDVPA